MKPDRSITAFIMALAGLMACGVHFTLMYAIATLACLRPQSIEPAFDIRFASIAMTAFVLAGLAAYLVHRIRNAPRLAAQPENDAGHFLDFVTAALGLTAVVVVLWVMLPVFFTTDCRVQ